ncbi:hypothetical protein D3C84_1028510 [compost metagenome]
MHRGVCFAGKSDRRTARSYRAKNGYAVQQVHRSACLTGSQLLAAQNIRHEARRRQRLAEQVALQRIAAESRQEVLLHTGFHAFGDDPQTQRLAEGDDG